MEQDVLEFFRTEGEAELSETADALDGDLGAVFLAIRSLYRDGRLVRTGPLRYQIAESPSSDTDTVADSSFEWNTRLEQ